MSISVVDVYGANFKREAHSLKSALWTHRTVAVDTEFPGILRNTPRDATQFHRYQDLRFNVACLKLIQVGLAVSDDCGSVAGVWQFNFCDFDARYDAHVLESVQLLRRNGVDFEKNRSEGISVGVFAAWFKAVLVWFSRSVKWVTFHGLYDVAFLTHIVIRKPLPPSVFGFSQLVKLVFGRVYDVKVVAECCPTLCLSRNNWGLQKLAYMLGIKRVGQAYQAGSDSWVTVALFDKFKGVYGLEEKYFEGVLYSIESRPTYLVMVNYNRYPVTTFLRYAAFPST